MKTLSAVWAFGRKMKSKRQAAVQEEWIVTSRASRPPRLKHQPSTYSENRNKGGVESVRSRPAYIGEKFDYPPEHRQKAEYDDRASEFADLRSPPGETSIDRHSQAPPVLGGPMSSNST
jgi:hypothetical protein